MRLLQRVYMDWAKCCKFRPDQKIGMYALPQFRKEFDVKKPLKRAIAYVSGLGHFDMFLNGEKVETTSWIRVGRSMTGVLYMFLLILPSNSIQERMP